MNLYTKSVMIDILYSDCDWKSFLPLTNKHDFSSELFINLLILATS